jgi:hypothetical protein
MTVRPLPNPRLTMFLFRSPMAAWLRGAHSIFPTLSSFGTTGDYRVARVAFEEAVKQRPGRIVTLRQKTRLLADSRTKN